MQKRLRSLQPLVALQVVQHALQSDSFQLEALQSHPHDHFYYVRDSVIDYVIVRHEHQHLPVLSPVEPSFVPLVVQPLWLSALHVALPPALQTLAEPDAR